MFTEVPYSEKPPQPGKIPGCVPVEGRGGQSKQMNVRNKAWVTTTQNNKTSVISTKYDYLKNKFLPFENNRVYKSLEVLVFYPDFYLASCK